MAKRTKGTPTDTNLHVLESAFRGGVEEIGPRMEVTAVPHLRRCVDAGLLEATPRGTARLTDAGRQAIEAYLVRFPARRQAVSS